MIRPIVEQLILAAALGAVGYERWDGEKRRGNTMSVHTRIANLRNPFYRIRKRIVRYTIITAISGTISFLVALALLHAGHSPFVSLAGSVLASGLLGYALLELWGFPSRKGRLSWHRLMQSALVGASAFAVRFGVLTLCLGLFVRLAPYDKLLSLALAYTASFLVGYLLRCRFVFKLNRHSETTRCNTRLTAPHPDDSSEK